MPRGPSLQVRDFLIVWNCVAKGIRSPQQILQIFDELEERTISRDSVSKLIGQYEEFIRLLPDYPGLLQALQEKPIATAQEKEHWDDLARVADTLQANLSKIRRNLPAILGGEAGLTKGAVVDGGFISSPNNLGPIMGVSDRDNSCVLEKTDSYLAQCLLSHLQAEFAEFGVIADWTQWADITEGMIDILTLVSHRRTFVGTCAVCESWESKG